MKAENTIKKTETQLVKLFLLTVLLVLFSTNIIMAAEPELKKGSIAGKITDKASNTALQYATVAVYSATDSSLINGTITNEEGLFSLENIPFGNYYLVAEYLGYERQVRDDIQISDDQYYVEINDIQLTEGSTDLDELTVVGQKRTQIIKADRKVINVDKNLSAQGGTAIDALKISPSITVNQDGEVLLRGSSSFKVLVDGKPTALKPNEVLKQMPAGRIENIELITNPSAKYDAEGTAGIINIITKKGLGAGMSGLINASAGTGDKYNADFNVNYTNDKLNVTLGANWKDEVQYYNMDELIETTLDGKRRSNDILFYREQSDKDLGANITLDYNFNPNNILSYSAEAGYTNLYIDANFKYDETIENQAGHSYVYETIGTAYLADYFTNNVSHTYRINESSNWINSLFYSKINYVLDSESDRYKTSPDFEINGITPYYSMELENENFSTEIRAKSDYSKSFENGARLELGGQYHKYHRYIDLQADNFNYTANSWEADSIFTNEFDFNEQIYSGYANLSGEKIGISYNLGLRMEYTNRLIESFTLNEKYEYKKLNHFPTLSLSKGLGEKAQLSLNYSRRIDRPDEYFLNPFPDVSNEFQEARGNPLLRPNLTDSYEFGYQKFFSKGMFSSQAFLRNTNDAYTQVIASNEEGIMILTFDNISDDKEFGIENMVNLQATKWWSLNASFNVMGQTSKGTMNEEAYDRSAFTFDTRLINSISIGKNTSVQLMGFYFHDRLGNSIGTVKRFYWFDASIQHNFFNQRLSVSLVAKDIFNTNQLKFDINRSDYRFYIHRKPEYPNIRLNISYKFNNYKNNSKRVKTKLKM
ncbi:outer membrane beta-barrel protein [Bacteroidota bacterium]